MLFNHGGRIPLAAGRRPWGGSPPTSLLISGIRDTRNLLGGITSACPHPGGGGDTHQGVSPPLPANGEDGDLAGTTRRFGDLGGTEWWQKLGPPLAAAGARGRTLHRVEMLLVPAGDGKLRQEVQPGKLGGRCHQHGLGPTTRGPRCSFGGGGLTYLGGCSLVTSAVGCDALSAAPPAPQRFLWVGDTETGSPGPNPCHPLPRDPPNLSSR